MLYQTLKTGLVDTPADLLVDEITNLMGRIDTESFRSSLQQMYGDVEWDKKTPLDLALMFVRGVKKANLFEFVEFVQVTRGSTQS